MARKSTPQPLTLADPKNLVNDEQDSFGRSPLSPKSPKSPRSPFRFNSKKNSSTQIQQSQPDQSLMQASDTQQFRATLPPSHTAPSLSSTQTSEVSGTQEKQERPSRSGFFSNYKASKSSSRLQQTETVRQVQDDTMSRDTDRAGLEKKGSENKPRSGMDPFRISNCHI